jgi:hypothetical protein
MNKDLFAAAPAVPYDPMFSKAWDDFDHTTGVVSYRYGLGKLTIYPPALTRRASILWVMQNPSRATAEDLDPTVRKCLAFSKQWGFQRVMVGNLFAMVSTDPKGLRSVDMPIPVGERNDAALERLAAMADRIMVAWGSDKVNAHRAPQVLELLRKHGDVYSLTVNKGGSPAHPLYEPYTAPCTIFAARAA